MRYLWIPLPPFGLSERSPAPQSWASSNWYEHMDELPDPSCSSRAVHVDIEQWLYRPFLPVSNNGHTEEALTCLFMHRSGLLGWFPISLSSILYVQSWFLDIRFTLSSYHGLIGCLVRKSAGQWWNVGQDVVCRWKMDNCMFMWEREMEYTLSTGDENAVPADLYGGCHEPLDCQWL